MPALLELQRAFAASMLHEEDDAVCGAVVDDGFAAAERLRIYRNTCRSTLIEALRITYPAVERLVGRSEEHTSELQSQSNLVCRLLLEKKKKIKSKFLLLQSANVNNIQASSTE